MKLSDNKTTLSDNKTGRIDWKYMLLLAGICVALQLPPLFFGVELCDSGFYLASYANIFTHPEAVEYGFMHYLTDVVGGALMLLFPGMFGMRLVGLIVNTLTALTVASLFPDRRMRPIVVAAIVVILAEQLDMPLTFSYDQLSALLTCVGLRLMLKGLSPLLPDDGRTSYTARPGHCDRMIIASGIVLGINVFSRMPNLLGILYIFIIPLLAWQGCLGMRRRGLQISMLMLGYLGGWLTGILAVFLLMLLLGHNTIFFHHLADLMNMVTSQSAEVSHGPVNLITVQLRAYMNMFRCGIAIAGVLALAAITGRLVKSCSLRRALNVVWVAAAVVVVVKYAFLSGSSTFTYFLGALFIIGCVGAIWRSTPRIRSTAVAGLAVILIFPLGSDGAIINHGTQAMWLASVPALLFYIRFLQKFAGATLPASRNLVTAIALLIGAAAFGRAASEGVYFDSTPMWECRGAVGVDGGRGVYTSPQRARALGEMVAEVDSVAREGEPVFISGMAPMLHYLTGTLPAIGNQSPELLSAEQLRLQLSRKLRKAPVLVMRLAAPAGDFSQPGDDQMHGRGEFSNYFHNEKKTDAVLSTLAELGYVPVDTMRYMIVYRPESGERSLPCY